MQFNAIHRTKDKNGVEIYEGDLLSWTDEEYLDGFMITKCSGIYEVKWNENTLRIDLFDIFSKDWYDLNDTEFDKIIGNIHENKELL